MVHEPGYSSPWEEYEARFSNEYWGSVAAAKDRLTDLPVLTAGGGGAWESGVNGVHA